MLTQIILVLVLLVLTLAVVWLYWRYSLVHQRIEALEQGFEGDIRVDLSPYLKLVIHEPQTIAQRESKLAKAVGALSPEYIKYRVYKQVASELEVALHERDIDVSIELVGLKGSKVNKQHSGSSSFTKAPASTTAGKVPSSSNITND